MNAFFRYLWFVIIVVALILALKAMAWADKDIRILPNETKDPYGPYVR